MVAKKGYIAIPQLIIGLMIYSVHLVLIKTNPTYNLSPIRWYLGDVLALFVCIPIFINIQIFFNVRREMKIRLLDIALYFFVFSLLFEIVLPIYLKRLTKDYIDIVAYALGGFLLYLAKDIKLKI